MATSKEQRTILPAANPGRRGHGDKDFEEIDLVAVGPPGIWAIEVKSWRGIILE